MPQVEVKQVSPANLVIDQSAVLGYGFWNEFAGVETNECTLANRREGPNTPSSGFLLACEQTQNQFVRMREAVKVRSWPGSLF